MNKEEVISEYAKCYKDSSYAIRTYLETYDNTQSKYVPFKLFPEQEMMLNNFEKYNENITKKYRQAGVSTATAAWISNNYNLLLKLNQKKYLF